MSTSKPNTDGILLFEQPFARIPYENYRKIFRTSRDRSQRELQIIQNEATDLARKAASGGTLDDLTALNAMISRVEGIKRKLTELNQTSGKQTQAVLRERFEHLSNLEVVSSTTDPHYDHFTDQRLDRWLVDWALRQGRVNTARAIAESKGIETLVDIDLFAHIRRIEDALANHSCTEALAWFNDNKVALRKANSTLEFELRLQEYIELARARKAQDAISYAQKYLWPWRETHFAQLQQASTLLAYPPTTQCGPYKRLYDPSRWSTLVRSFRLAIYNFNTIPTEPLLHLSLYAGLASLKLAACFDHATKNIDCPVCDPALGQLALEVPFSHHFNSTIVCRITGKIMDEDNMPMAFPNGNVYSREALEEMAAKNEGQVVCPRTGDRLEFSALRKVFIS